MCGIAGIFNYKNPSMIQLELLESMADSMVYRGPDDRGFYTDSYCGLGFRRLSIFDLETGNQPISSEDDQIVLVCNGEIFNYKELRSDLIARGHTFKTHSDVEVILHLYEEFGRSLLDKLNGQFAFALYDKRQKSLFMARDPMGIAPLHYTFTGKQCVFGSEIKAILKHPEVSRKVNMTALDQILSFPGLLSPHTMFENIFSLKPGYALWIQNGEISEFEYWDLDYPRQEEIEQSYSVEQVTKDLDDALNESIRLRLQADVPVGFYLSGGLDSSLIAGMIHQQNPARSRHSFSIGFNENRIDERKFQKTMVEQTNSIHHESVFDWEQISERLKQAVFHAETPLKESYNTCSLALSNLVRKNNIKVILTGEGADELFGGYVGYRLDHLRGDEGGFDDFSLEAMMEQELRERIWGDPDFFFEKNYSEFAESKSAIYSSHALENYHTFDFSQNPFIDISKLKGRHPSHKRAYINAKIRMADHLLQDHGDRVAFANSVEARYPFLDPAVVAISRLIPPEMMVLNNSEKYPIRKVAEKYVPPSILNREKFGFVAPGSPALIRQNIDWVEDLLSYDRIKRQGYFNPDTIERLKTQYRSDEFQVNTTFDDDFLMIVLTFNIFLEQFDMPAYHCSSSIQPSETSNLS